MVEDEVVETRVDRAGGEGVPVDKGCHAAGWVGDWAAQAESKVSTMPGDRARQLLRT